MSDLLNERTKPPHWAHLLLQWLLVLWAVVLVIYFEHKEGLFNWTWLEQPATGSFFHAHGLPDPRFAPTERAGGYLTILSNAFGPYDVNWGNIPYLDVTIAALMIAAYSVLGWMLLGCFEIYAPLLARICVSLTLGCATVGIVGELLCMAHLLKTPVVWGAWILMLVGAFLLRAVAPRHWYGPQTGPGGSRLSYAGRLAAARDWFRLAHPQPLGIAGKFYFWVAAALAAFISFVLLLHAIGEPETYWDSLILYMGYARMMFQEHAFPYKVVGQVGIGLGANYPHLYPVLTAQTAALAAHWNDMFAQVLPPVAGIATTLLIFCAALELTRDRLIAVSAALLYRAVPYGLSYTQYASDYAIAILFTATFLYLAIKYVKEVLPGYRWLMLGIAAGAVHINYLMWVLWLTAAIVILAAHARRSPLPRGSLRDDADDEELRNADRPLELRSPDFLSNAGILSISALFHRAEFWWSSLIALALASPWYIRNIVLTGNPVYAFFYNIFKTSKRVNPEVMKSAEVEWLLNGDGLGRVGRTLPQKLANSWAYFVTSSLHWKLAPVFVAFVVPGFVLALCWLLLSLLRRRNEAASDLRDTQLRTIIPAAFLFLLLWFYAYCVADFYLYQIIVVLPLFGLFACYLFQFCSRPAARGVLYALTLLVGFAPGVVMGLMGFKLKNTGVYVGMPPPQMNVTALRHLFMDRERYYRMEFNGDMEMFSRLHELPANRTILTHENRHLLLDPKLKIVHLDDWEVQQAYRKPAEERVRLLDSLGITYYLYVSNEDKHQVNSLLGMDELIEKGYFKLEYESKSSGSSTPELVTHKVIPANMNVLYKRASLEQ